MRTILVVDGDHRVGNIVRILFTEHKGYRVITLTSGEEALTKAREIKPDVVVADINLYDRDGYEVSKEIKSDASLGYIPVLLLNSGFDVLDVDKVIESGADDILTKPFGIEVITRIEGLIADSRARKGNFPSTFGINSIFGRILTMEKYYRNPLRKGEHHIRRAYEFIARMASPIIENFDHKGSGSVDALIKMTLYRLRYRKAQSDAAWSGTVRLPSLQLTMRRTLIALVCLVVIVPAFIIIASAGRKEGKISSFFNSLKPTKGFSRSESRSGLETAPEIPYPENYKGQMGNNGLEQKKLLSSIKNAETDRPGPAAGDVRSSSSGVLSIEEARKEQRVMAIESNEMQAKEKITEVSIEKEVTKKTETAGEEVNGSKYQVKKGDTILRIARKFNTSANKLKDLNDIKDDKIRVGQVLAVPFSIGEERAKQGVIQVEKKAPEKVNQNSAVLSGGKYTVKKGDNLYRISVRFNTSVKELRALNNLKSDKITIGQSLAVPALKQEMVSQPVKAVATKKKADPLTIHIGKSSFYTPLVGMPVQSLTLENKGDMAYRDIKIRIRYYSNSGTEMGSEIVNIPLVLLPYSKKSYIKEGVSIKTDSSRIYTSNVEIVGATPLSLPEGQVKLDY